MNASSGQFLKLVCAVCQIVAALCPTFEKLLVAEKFGVGRERSQRVKKSFWNRPLIVYQEMDRLANEVKALKHENGLLKGELREAKDASEKAPSAVMSALVDKLRADQVWTLFLNTLPKWHRMAIQPTPQPIIRVFCGKIIVVYFDQRLGAAHSNCWSK